MLKVALKSAWNRRWSVALAILSISVSLFLLLSIDKIRREAKASFTNTISGTDLIVGSKSGAVNLLLYSIFQMGSPLKAMSYSTYQEISAWQEWSWTVPISLGDSHRGFRVIATTPDYFRHYSYGERQPLTFYSGKEEAIFQDIYEVILGYEVHLELGYQLGDSLTVNHGMASGPLSEHEDKPFTVIGILNPTGTPVDRGIYISLQGMEAIHVDWRSGARLPLKIDAETAKKFDLNPKIITAFLAGLENRATIFRVQHRINQFRGEAVETLEAIIPGVTLSYLWQSIGNLENVLLFISVLVLFTGGLGLLIAQLAVLNERRREIAVLRAVGAGPREIFFLFIAESLFMMVAATVMGLTLLYGFLLPFQDFLAADYGLYITLAIDYQQILIVLVAMGLGIAFSLIPAVISYRQSLKDGLIVRF